VAQSAAASIPAASTWASSWRETASSAWTAASVSSYRPSPKWWNRIAPAPSARYSGGQYRFANASQIA
jgi:hypothetical protein